MDVPSQVDRNLPGRGRVDLGRLSLDGQGDHNAVRPEAVACRAEVLASILELHVLNEEGAVLEDLETQSLLSAGWDASS